MLLRGLWKLLDEADCVITKNGKRFDKRVVFGRFAINNMGPPSPFLHEDIEQLFRKHFDLPYYNMDYLSQKFCKRYKKSRHTKFAGMDLWRECMGGNREAWGEMEKYNKMDVLVTEELHEIIAPWGGGVNLNSMREGNVFRCPCGSIDLQKRGFQYTATGKFQQYSCNECRAWCTESGATNNLLSTEKKRSLRGRP